MADKNKGQDRGQNLQQDEIRNTGGSNLSSTERSGQNQNQNVGNQGGLGNERSKERQPAQSGSVREEDRDTR